MRKITALILAVLLMFPLTGCQQSPAHTPDMTASNSPGVSATPYSCQIGVAMPTKSVPRWERDGANIKEQLEAKGYTVALMYADNNQTTQNSQIEELVAKDCKVLVIAAIDVFGLDSVLAEAKAAGVTVICYDRQTVDTVNVDYYVSFDIFRYGALQGEYIETALGLRDRKGPFNIEVFAGDSGDANMMFFFEGAMSILRPYIENGQLVVKSSQTDSMDAYTQGYTSENAKVRMDGLLSEYYTQDHLDAVFALNDSIARGVITSLEDAGYTEFPIITGMDCDKRNVIGMKAGKQSMSVFQDTRILTAKVVQMVDAVMKGEEVPFTTVTEHISNGITFSMVLNDVPSFLCDPYVVTVDNIQEILIDGGTYTEADLEG